MSQMRVFEVREERPENSFVLQMRLPMTVDPFKIRILFKTARIKEAIAALEKYKMKRGKKRR